MWLLSVSEKRRTHRFLNVLVTKLGLKSSVNFIIEAKDNRKIVILSVRIEISEISVKIWRKEGIKAGYCLILNFD